MFLESYFLFFRNILNEWVQMLNFFKDITKTWDYDFFFKELNPYV